MTIKIGDIVKTSDGPLTYRITHMHVCRKACINHEIMLGNKAPTCKPHMHLTCKVVYLPGKDNPGNITPPRDNFYLNGYDPDTLKSTWNDDYLIVVERSTTPMQERLFN